MLRRILLASLLSTYILCVLTLRDVDPRVAHHNPLSQLKPHTLHYRPANGVSITAGTNVLNKSGEWVEVSWCCEPQPDIDDWVVLYAPANVDPTTTSPVKLWKVGRNKEYLKTGMGSARFLVHNHRASMRFMFVKGGYKDPTIIATSDVIKLANPNEPVQGHLALTGIEGEMLVQWTTRDVVSPMVKWGTASGNYTFSGRADTDTYTKEDLCGEPATTVGWLEPGSFHRAVMSDLKPGHTFYYVFGDEAFGFSEEFSFVAPPATGPNQSIKFLAIADLGQQDGDDAGRDISWLSHFAKASYNTTNLLANEEGQQLILHNGDISYAMGYGATWDLFFEQIAPIATKMPYMTCVGNHEADWPKLDRFEGRSDDSWGECGIPYKKRLRMPRPVQGDLWYSFDMGPVHFLQYNTEVDFEQGSEQYRFIEDDLKKVDRAVTPWVVVSGHRPIYISSTDGRSIEGDNAVSKALKEHLEPLFMNYKVDLTLHGHHHSYQRTCPVFEDECKGYTEEGIAKAPVHLVIGNAGAGLCWNIIKPRLSIMEEVVVVHGYSRFEVNATHLKMEAIRSSDGAVIDTLELKKAPVASPTGQKVVIS